MCSEQQKEAPRPRLHIVDFFICVWRELWNKATNTQLPFLFLSSIPLFNPLSSLPSSLPPSLPLGSYVMSSRTGTRWTSECLVKTSSRTTSPTFCTTMLPSGQLLGGRRRGAGRPAGGPMVSGLMDTCCSTQKR